MKSENLICGGKNGVYEKRSNVHICQKLVIYVKVEGNWQENVILN